jgi:chemotaxis signal transduction protein
MTRQSWLDWEQVRRRLQTGDLSVERVQAVLRRRAERLARPVQPRSSAGERAVLIFHLAGERYGFELDTLAQVIANPLCAPVPGGPEWLWGVLQVNGEIRPVWDLYRVLGIAPPANGAEENALLLRCGGREFGVRTGPVEEIRLLSPLPEVAQHLEPFVKWTAPDLLPVLDPKALLRIGEME